MELCSAERGRAEMVVVIVSGAKRGTTAQDFCSMFDNYDVINRNNESSCGRSIWVRLL